MPRFVALLASCTLALPLVGCSGQTSPPANIEGGPEGSTAGSSSNEPGETFSYVIAVEAEYYTSGPQQGRPPDGTFPAGTKVNVLRRTGGYSRVRSPAGVEAYVASDALQQPGVETLP